MKETSFPQVRPRGPKLPRPGGTARKIISIGQETMVSWKPMHDDGVLPLHMFPTTPAVDLVSWARHERPLIDEKLAVHGAIAFRGFNLNSADRFRDLAEAVIDDLMDSTEHTPLLKKSPILRPGFYPAEDRLTWHNEKSYAPEWPGRIMFGCEAPAPSGGESLIVDSRLMVRRMDPEIRERFRQVGVMYVRNYGNEIGRPWPMIFQTNQKSEVEAFCRENQIECEWQDGGRLRTRKVLPAISIHPKTGEEVWFNQVQHWHSTSLEPATRASLQALVGEEGMPRNSFYGDGTRIEDEVIHALNELSLQIDGGFLLTRGDVLLMDNMLVAHGRTAYAGDRKIMVAMGEPGSYQGLETITN